MKNGGLTRFSRVGSPFLDFEIKNEKMSKNEKNKEKTREYGL